MTGARISVDHVRCAFPLVGSACPCPQIRYAYFPCYGGVYFVCTYRLGCMIRRRCNNIDDQKQANGRFFVRWEAELSRRGILIALLSQKLRTQARRNLKRGSSGTSTRTTATQNVYDDDCGTVDHNMSLPDRNHTAYEWVYAMPGTSCEATIFNIVYSRPNRSATKERISSSMWYSSTIVWKPVKIRIDREVWSTFLSKACVPCGAPVRVMIYPVTTKGDIFEQRKMKPLETKITQE